jgi:outer membrane immunogenic protein
MKNILFAAFAVSSIATASYAGSLNDPIVQEVQTAQLDNWAGPYLGVGLGTTDQTSDVNGSAFVGYRFDLGNVVVGSELAYQAGSSSTEEIVLDANVGYDAGAWLPYASVGYVWDDTSEGAVYGVGVDYKVDSANVVGVKVTKKDFAPDFNVAVRYSYNF